MTLYSVIRRLETAIGPSRELDAAIFCAIGLTYTQERHCREWCRMDGRTDLTRKHYLAAWAPDYTRSLDAALTLVPEGCAFDVGCEIDFTPFARVFGHDIHADEFAATPALALCLAALRARAQQQKE